MTAAKTTVEFTQLMNEAPDPLSLVIKGHHSIEQQVQEALSEALPSANKLELRRVAFLLKVDLLIALRVFSNRTRPVFDFVNTIRNRFAHNPYADFDLNDAQRVKSLVLSLDPNYPCDGDPKYLLRVLLHVCFDYASRRYQQLVVEKSKAQIMADMMNDPAWHAQIVPGYEELPPIPQEMLEDVRTQTDDEVNRRLQAALAQTHPYMKL